MLEVLESVNFLSSAGKCFVVMGIAPGWVEKCVGLAHKEIAEEMAAKNKGEDAKEQRMKFARHYLEKIVNIEIPVPPTKEEGSQSLLSRMAIKTPIMGWMQTLLVVVGAILMAFGIFAYFALDSIKLQESQKPIQSPSPVLPTATAENRMEEKRQQEKADSSVSVQTERVEKKVLKELIENKAPTDLLEKEVSAGTYFRPGQSSQAYLPYVFAAGAGFTSVFIFAIMLLPRGKRLIEDSNAFSMAIKAWSPVIAAKCKSPRSLKRFKNLVRYLAMMQRNYPVPATFWARWWKSKDIRTDGGADEAEREDAIPEAVLVALSALHNLHPDAVADRATLTCYFLGQNTTLGKAYPD